MVGNNVLKLVASNPVLIFSKKMKNRARVRVIMGSAPKHIVQERVRAVSKEWNNNC